MLDLQQYDGDVHVKLRMWPPVEIKEGFYDVSVNESFAGLVLLVAGEGAPGAVFNPADGLDDLCEPLLKVVQQLEEVLRQLGDQSDAAAHRAEQDAAGVRDGGVAKVLHHQ